MDNLEVKQLKVTSTTPPADSGLYKIDETTMGVVGDLKFRHPKTGAMSSALTVTSTSAQGVGNADVTTVGVVRQGFGASIPARPAADIVHWYVHDRMTMDLTYPSDQLFPSGPLLLYPDSTQGAWHDFTDAAVHGVPIASVISSVWDKSPRRNHATASGTSRPLLSARVNHMPTTATLSGWVKSASGVGVNPVVTPAAGLAPNGTMTAVKIDLNCGDAGNISNRSLLRASHTSPAYTEYFGRIWIKAATPADVGKTVRLVNENSLSHSNVTYTLTEQWTKIDRDVVRDNIGTNSGWLVECRGTYTQATASVLVWQPELRYLADNAGIPAHQEVTSDTVYDSVGFPVGAYFDGTDDYVPVAAGGGASVAWHWSAAIRMDGLGTAQTLFSDAGTNTGLIVRLTTTGNLQLSAGNGTAYTSATSIRSLIIGERAVLSAWYDGTNIYVQIDNDTPTSAAFSTLSAGSSGYSIGRDNGTATGHFKGFIYSALHVHTSLSAANRAAVVDCLAAKAKF